MTKEQLINIVENTLDIINEEEYTTINGVYNEIKKEEIEYRFYPSLSNTKKLKHRDWQTETNISVVNLDTFQAAKEILDLGEDRVCVLNMASDKRPGGGVLSGSKAQEEELCRRSNLLYGLYKFFRVNIFKEQANHKYPLPTFGGIYTKGITVFRHPISYNLMDDPFKVNVISVAGVRKPTLDSAGLMKENDANIMRGKIRMILRIAVKEHQYNLILGALGCGAFGCPSNQVASLFKSVIEEEEFRGRFKYIRFAIIEDKNSKKGNYKPFKNIFK